jgi:HlyD family secretion protein
MAAVAVIAAILLRPDVYEVESTVLREGVLQVTLDADGVTRVRRHVEMTAPVTGRIAESRVRAGDSVTVGEIVGTLSPAPLDPRTRDQARAALESARALVREASARAEQAVVSLEEARRARRRAENMATAGALSARELERAIDAERLQDRELTASQERHRAAEQDERRARLALTASDPATPIARDAVRLRAPMSGRVLRVFEEHDRVVPAGTPLLEIGDTRSVEVVVDVLTRDAPDARVGRRILVRVADEAPRSARVVRVEPSAFTKVSPLGVEEQRVNVIAQFDEPQSDLGNGFEVRAAIVLYEGSVLKMPVSALVPLDSGWAAFVVERGRTSLRPIRVGQRATQEVEVTEGLRTGDIVVLHPDDRLLAGSRVKLAAPR